MLRFFRGATRILVGLAHAAEKRWTADDNDWKHGCLRGDLLDIISGGIPDMPGLGSDEWLFPGAAAYYKVHMAYPDDERQRIRDLDDFTITEDTIETRTLALTSFIQQFRNINNR